MRKCPHCDKNISDYVIKCTHCGKPVDVDAGAITKPVFTPRSPATSAKKEEPPKNVKYADGDEDAQALSIPKAGGRSGTAGDGPSNIPSPASAPAAPSAPPSAPPGAPQSSAAAPQAPAATPAPTPAAPAARPRVEPEPFSTEIPKGDPYWVMKPDAERPAMLTSPAAQRAAAPTTPTAPPAAPGSPPPPGAPAPATTPPSGPSAATSLDVSASPASKGRSGNLPAALAIAGGIVAVAGSMMAWASAQTTIPGEGKKAADIVISTTAKGTSVPPGIVVAALGVVLIILGLAYLLGTGAPSARMGRLQAALIPGLLILGVVAYAFVSKDSLVKSGFVSSAGASGIATSDAESLFSQLTSSGALTATLGAGVMVAAVGGLLGVVAGAVSLVGGRGRR